MTKTDLCIAISFFMPIAVLHASDSTAPSWVSRALNTQFPFGFINSEWMQQERSKHSAMIYIDGLFECLQSGDQDPKEYCLSQRAAMLSVNNDQLLLNHQANCVFYAGLGTSIAALAKFSPNHKVRRLASLSLLAPGLLAGGSVLKVNAAWQLPHINLDLVGEHIKKMGEQVQAKATLESVDRLIEELKKRELQKNATSSNSKLRELSNQQPPDNV